MKRARVKVPFDIGAPTHNEGTYSFHSCVSSHKINLCLPISNKPVVA